MKKIKAFIVKTVFFCCIFNAMIYLANGPSAPDYPQQPKGPNGPAEPRK